MLEVVEIVLWYSGVMVEPVEESESDVNFSMGVAARGKTEVEFAATFTFFQPVSIISHAPGLIAVALQEVTGSVLSMWLNQ